MKKNFKVILIIIFATISIMLIYNNMYNNKYYNKVYNININESKFTLEDLTIISFKDSYIVLNNFELKFNEVVDYASMSLLYGNDSIYDLAVTNPSNKIIFSGDNYINNEYSLKKNTSLTLNIKIIINGEEQEFYKPIILNKDNEIKLN